MARSRFWFGGFAAMAMSSAALGHVFWLQPSSFRPRANSVLKLELRVGDTLPGDVLPRNESKIITFVSIGPDGERAVGGVDGADVAGFQRLTAPGISVIGYTAKPSEVSLEAEKFETYLREKGLEKIIAARAAAGESARAVNEIYTRCAKAIVRVGSEQATGFDRVVGLRLEIIPENDPTSMKSGDELRIRVEFEGNPIVGALVEARSPAPGTATVSARTDQTGHVVLLLPAPGMWVVDSVEMVRAEIGSKPAGSSKTPDWHSFWASLCVEVPGDTGPTRSDPPTAKPAVVTPR